MYVVLALHTYLIARFDKQLKRLRKYKSSNSELRIFISYLPFYETPYLQ
jgi:hypothetical protein